MEKYRPLLPRWPNTFLEKNSKVIIYIDMDGVLCDYEGSKAHYAENRREVRHPQYEPGFFSGLEPLPGAVAAFAELSRRAGTEVYILTSPAENSPACCWKGTG